MPGIGVAVGAFGAVLSLAAAFVKMHQQRKADRNIRRITVTVQYEDNGASVKKIGSISSDQVSALLELIEPTAQSNQQDHPAVAGQHT